MTTPVMTRTASAAPNQPSGSLRLSLHGRSSGSSDQRLEDPPGIADVHKQPQALTGQALARDPAPK
jgi:hypothetical protein